jgi:hypothetical protein
MQNHQRSLSKTQGRRLPAKWQSLFTLLAAVCLSPNTQAATIWTGAPTTFSKTGADDPTDPAHQDRITPNVWITRDINHGIYNAKSEASFAHSFSPADTEWANGTTANYSTLSYHDWNTWAKGVNPTPPSTVNVPAVVHLISEDIYIDIKFLSWSGGGTFSYQRSTGPAPNNPPTVAITNPPNNVILHPPASFVLRAAASDSDGSVTNVQFFQGVTSLGNSPGSPYSAAVNNLSVGDYTFSAVATDDGGATSTDSITVHVAYLPPTISITNPLNNLFILPPASFVLSAAAADQDGTVTNVQFFRGTTLLGNSTASPFSIAVTNLPQGDYSFSAIASDNDGLKATNSITIHVGDLPPNISGASLQRPTPSSFQFSFLATVGSNYVVQRSFDLVNWIGIVTNIATNNPMPFLDNAATASRGMYRVGRLPGP